MVNGCGSKIDIFTLILSPHLKLDARFFKREPDHTSQNVNIETDYVV